MLGQYALVLIVLLLVPAMNPQRAYRVEDAETHGGELGGTESVRREPWHVDTAGTGGESRRDVIGRCWDCCSPTVAVFLLKDWLLGSFELASLKNTRLGGGGM